MRNPGEPLTCRATEDAWREEKTRKKNPDSDDWGREVHGRLRTPLEIPLQGLDGKTPDDDIYTLQPYSGGTRWETDAAMPATSQYDREIDRIVELYEVGEITVHERDDLMVKALHTYVI